MITALVVATIVSAFAASFAAEAQPAGQARRVGVLFPAVLDGSRMDAIRHGLNQVVGIAGSGIAFEPRSAEGDVGRLPALAAGLVQARVDVIVAIAPAAVRAAREATATIPIVALDLESDPVMNGFVTSLARPGGNVTGIFFDAPEAAGKWLQMLQEIVPGKRVAILWDPNTGPAQVEAAESAGRSLNIATHRLEARQPGDIAAALRTAAESRAGAVLVLSSPIFGVEAPKIAALALQHKLPSITLFPVFARSGGLISYGPDNLELLRQAGTFVGRILSGTAPEALPVQRPIRLHLLVNLRTAKALDLTIPQSLLVRADEVIQ
jgi:putative ABC transport system substrate-binding protein